MKGLIYHTSGLLTCALGTKAAACQVSEKPGGIPAFGSGENRRLLC